MKTLKESILSSTKTGKSAFILHPKTKEELTKMINDEIKKNGNSCSLNHIDTSEITNMASLFLYSDFNGDISKWDVSNVDNMCYMFSDSKFKGDISNWTLKSSCIHQGMFFRCYLPKKFKPKKNGKTIE